MEKSYKVRGLRRLRTCWGERIVATIHLDKRQIGTLKDCPDSGKSIFDFPLQTDKIVFESFINQWWSGIKPFDLYEQNACELAAQLPAYSPPIAEKMRYWVKSVIAAAEAERLAIAA